MPLTKTAFLGTLLRKFGPTALSRPLGTLLEKGMHGAARTIGVNPLHMRYVAGIPRQAVTEAAQNAVFGGLLSGGINAYTAEPGDRGSAFVKGFGSGLLPGAGFGILSGAGTRAVRNLRNVRLQNLAKTNKLTNSAIKRQFDEMGFKDQLGKAFTDKGLPGQIARTKLLGSAGGFGAGWILPGMLLPDEEPEAPEPPKPAPIQQPQFQPNAPTVYEQPQYKAGSFKPLTSIDFTKMPSYTK